MQVRHRGRIPTQSPLPLPSGLQQGVQREQAWRLGKQQSGLEIRRSDDQLQPGASLMSGSALLETSSQEAVMVTQESMAIMQAILDMSAEGITVITG